MLNYPPAVLMEERIARVRFHMAEAAVAAGRDPQEILLCAVSKTQTSETVRMSAGMPVDCFGENHMQELVAHHQDGAYLGKNVHFIGHLQTNKVKKVVGLASLIQSVDSLRLLEAIEKEAGRQGVIQDILLELNLAGEESKMGAGMEDLWPMAEQAAALPHIRLRGLMGIPPAGISSDDNRRYFANLRTLYTQLGEKYPDLPIDTLSMGMSASYKEAILEGATIVRVGSAIYGARDYSRKP
ncbi:MAG: YggS family pyridoxal phosphate-dependent enzyme [Clostridia bacterium]|nr:YggS family pyridoxal phosphate-dependent enzyme [Clostridia bacterium]